LQLDLAPRIGASHDHAPGAVSRVVQAAPGMTLEDRMAIDLDPIRAPDAYRAMLLAALGDDDPAAVQAETPRLLRALVADAGDALRVPPVPGEWSAVECLAHLVDGELIVSARSRWIVAEDEPDIVGYDQDLWVSRLRQVDEDPQALLTAFEALRRWNLDLWARTPATDRARIGIHRERGPESYELTFRLAAGHDRVHLDQAQRALDAARRTAAGA
jgi:hypothetical protein